MAITCPGVIARIADRRASNAPAATAGVEVGRVGRLGGRQEDPRPARRGLQDRRHRRRGLRAGAARGSAVEGPVERRQERRVRRRRRRRGRADREVVVVGGGPVERRVPGPGRLADPLERRDRDEAVRGLDLGEDPEHLLRVVVDLVEDRVDRPEVDVVEVLVRRVGDRPAGSPEGGFLAPLGVRLGRAPVDVEATLRVEAAHVDALDRAGLGALEAGLALERAPLVVQELQPAAELRRDLGRILGVEVGHLRLEEPAQGQGHAADDAEAGDGAHRANLIGGSRR